MENNNPKGKVRVYAAGGAAINIAAQLVAMAYNFDIMADLEVVAIDSSQGNMAVAGVDKLDKYVVEGLSGSGKVRTTNLDAIKAAIPEILHLHKPLDLNIVLSSAGGGTGSVVAPLLLGRLQEMGRSVIPLSIGGRSDLTETRNSLRTIQSYEGQAKKTNVPVNMLYLEQSETMSESKADETMVSAITYLAVLFSQRNHRIDPKDLEHFLHFTKAIPNRSAQLTALSIIVRSAGDNSVNQEIEKLGHPISLVALVPAGHVMAFTDTPEYQKTGILPNIEDDGKGPNILAGKSVYFVITEGVYPKIKADLNAKVVEMESNINVKTKQQDALVADVDDDGMAM